jgi:hypothetical protein
MPEKLILRDVSVVVDGTTLTTSARSVNVNFSAAEVNVTAFGGDGWEEFEPGLKSGEIEVEFYQGFDSGGVHDTLFPLSESNEEFVLRIGPKGDTGASDNPVFVANVKLYGYRFLQGDVGAASTNPVTFRMTGAPTLNST